jgi:hypothetical protein
MEKIRQRIYFSQDIVNVRSFVIVYTYNIKLDIP